MFDDIMLLSGGRTVYFGPSSGVVPYFTKQGHPVPQNTNPADALIDAISGPDRGKALLKINKTLKR
jgi:ABC-type multidrug transport system ATPase subunit